jgi:hypothetical protein
VNQAPHRIATKGFGSPAIGSRTRSEVAAAGGDDQ